MHSTTREIKWISSCVLTCGSDSRWTDRRRAGVIRDARLLSTLAPPRSNWQPWLYWSTAEPDWKGKLLLTNYFPPLSKQRVIINLGGFFLLLTSCVSFFCDIWYTADCNQINYMAFFKINDDRIFFLRSIKLQHVK